MRYRVAAVPMMVGAMLSVAVGGFAYDQHRAASEFRAKYVAEIEALAKWCEENGLADEAQKTRHVLGPTDPHKVFIPVLPDQVGGSLPLPDGNQSGGRDDSADSPHPNPLPVGEGTEVGPLPVGEGTEAGPRPKGEGTKEKIDEWVSRLAKLRRDHAAALYDLARAAVRNGQAGLAFDLAIAAIRTDPDYEPARRLFGYQKFRDQWRTAYEVKKLRSGFVWSDKFGWLPKAYLRRYEDGQRFDNGRWISAEEDARRHRDIRQGWDVETEHYTIRTNHSIEAAVALGVKLERLYRLWQQMLVRYFASEADVVAMFEGRFGASAPRRKHQIVYFRDRDDYRQAMKDSMPDIETCGVYRMGRAYFFADPKSDDRTLYHEATHQLFHESRPIVADVGRDANFWIIEGIALFLESLHQEDGFLVLGGFDDERVYAARYRLLEDDFYVPLAEFTGYGRERFQTDPRIATLYSQAAGLANFLVFYDGGRYRDALVAYLVAVYTGRDRPDTLAKLTGVRYRTLDRQYREFIENGSKKAEGVE